MSSGAIHTEGSPHPGMQADFRLKMEAWRAFLSHCGRKPGRKSVHNLRVATLRLQAALEYWLSRLEPGSPLIRVIERWVRQGKKLRRALGPLRQADVSLDKLARVRRWANPAANGHPVFPKDCLGAIEEIEQTVMRRREAAVEKFAAQIKRRRKRLSRLSKKLETSLEGLVPALETGIGERLQAQIEAAAVAFPAFDAENLHDFRKRIKKIRYLAEVFAPVDAEAARQAAMLKRMTGAIGEWHDWQALTQEALRAGRGNAAMTAATGFLQAQADRSYERARMLCARSMARLLKTAMNGSGPRAAAARKPPEQVPRKPVVSVTGLAHGIQAERSLHAFIAFKSNKAKLRQV